MLETSKIGSERVDMSNQESYVKESKGDSVSEASFSSGSFDSVDSPEGSISTQNTIDSSSSSKSDLDKAFEEIKKLKKQAEEAVNDAKSATQKSDSAFNLVVVGFIALLLIVVSMLYGYWHYVSADAMKYISDLSRIESSQENASENLIEFSDRLSQYEESLKDYEATKACLKNRRYWDIETCF